MMPVLEISLSVDGRPATADEIGPLRFDIEREVGPVIDDANTAAHAKGSAADWANIAVAVLSSQAITALIGVLKAKVERDSSSEIIVKGQAGEVHVKSEDMTMMEGPALHRLIERVMGDSATGGAYAKGSSGSSQPV